MQTTFLKGLSPSHDQCNSNQPIGKQSLNAVDWGEAAIVLHSIVNHSRNSRLSKSSHAFKHRNLTSIAFPQRRRDGDVKSFRRIERHIVAANFIEGIVMAIRGCQDEEMTPRELARRCAQERESWSDAEYRIRAGQRREPMTVKRASAHGVRITSEDGGFLGDD